VWLNVPWRVFVKRFWSTWFCTHLITNSNSFTFIEITAHIIIIQAFNMTSLSFSYVLCTCIVYVRYSCVLHIHLKRLRHHRLSIHIRCDYVALFLWCYYHWVYWFEKCSHLWVYHLCLIITCHVCVYHVYSYRFIVFISTFLYISTIIIFSHSFISFIDLRSLVVIHSLLKVKDTFTWRHLLITVYILRESLLICVRIFWMSSSHNVLGDPLACICFII